MDLADLIQISRVNGVIVHMPFKPPTRSVNNKYKCIWKLMFDKSKYIINYNHILNYLVDICFWNWYLIISAYLSNDICTSCTYDSVNLIYDDFLCMPIPDLYRVSHRYVDNFGLNFLFFKTRYSCVHNSPPFCLFMK